MAAIDASKLIDFLTIRAHISAEIAASVEELPPSRIAAPEN
jgi:hypothetical protein